MSFEGGSPGIKAIQALLGADGKLTGVADRDWAAAASLIIKKLLVAAGQTADSLSALRAATGAEIFDSQLKSLSHHQAKLLAKRLDKTVSESDLSTARAATAFILARLAAPAPAPKIDPVTEEVTAPEVIAEPETATTETPGDNDTPPSPPATPNPYFGRKSFRTG